MKVSGFLPGGNALENVREKSLAVFRQVKQLAAGPRRHGPRFQSRISAASGAWSDRCDHGWLGSTMGEWPIALRT